MQNRKCLKSANQFGAKPAASSLSTRGAMNTTQREAYHVIAQPYLLPISRRLHFLLHSPEHPSLPEGRYRHFLHRQVLAADISTGRLPLYCVPTGGHHSRVHLQVLSCPPAGSAVSTRSPSAPRPPVARRRHVYPQPAGTTTSTRSSLAPHPPTARWCRVHL
jgi:hypothetical protein